MAKELGVRYSRLRKAIAAFDRRTGRPLFKTGSGRQGTTAIAGEDTKGLFDRLSHVVEWAKPMFPSPGFRIRIAAGVTACSCLLPGILEEFASGPPRTRGSRPITFDLSYGTPAKLNDQRDEADILLVEVADTATGEGVFRIPLRLIVHRTHRLARVKGFGSLGEVVQALDGERLAILAEHRHARPAYPAKVIKHPRVVVETLRSYSLIHAMVMTGTATALSTPLLLSDEQRRELRVLRLPEDSGYITLRLECPMLGGLRSTEERRVIGNLYDIIYKYLTDQMSDQAEESVRRREWHVSYRDGEPKWIAASIEWYKSGPHTYVGWYEVEGVKYHLDGNLTLSPDGQYHLVFKAVRDGSKTEEFVASYICDDAGLTGQQVAAGVWLGRRSPTVGPDQYTPSLGFSVLLQSGEESPDPPRNINSLLKVVRKGELKQLKIPKQPSGPQYR